MSPRTYAEAEKEKEAGGDKAAPSGGDLVLYR